MKNDEEIVKLAPEENDVDTATNQKASQQQPITDKLCLAKCFFGVLICYIVYAICHESITRQVFLLIKLILN